MALIDVTKENFEATVTQPGLTIVDCWSPTCRPCMQFMPVFEKAAENHPDATFAKLNTAEQMELGAALQIMAVPTIMVFRDGVLVYRDTGALPAHAFEDLISQANALDMDEVRRQIAEQENQE
ncbi:MAG: thioredoxin family protein [Corynebacterium sp.]|uniref:thioredoxin family protein n=1 Tax=Corynebacterium sp. TaxID=1720 RepID=UPI0026DB6C9F|nr:thioredoxin family protein [Corynebacterium sp.]MDO5098763.1 thioredoxin family protein [Corynebacterium sp.]